MSAVTELLKRIPADYLPANGTEILVRTGYWLQIGELVIVDSPNCEMVAAVVEYDFGLAHLSLQWPVRS